MEPGRIAGVVAAHLKTVLKSGDFDVRVGEDEAEVYTDGWTINVGANGGFLAIDDEPESPREYEGARAKAFGAKTIAAIAAADAELEGALSTVLAAGRDPFTLAFLAALRPEGDGATETGTDT